MKHRQFYQRAAALGMSVCLLMSSAQASVFLGGYTYFYDIAPDVTYQRTDGYTADGAQKQNVITFDPTNGDIEAIGVLAGEPLYGSKATLSDVIDALEAAGENVIAGINADFFSTENGISTGLVVQDGRILSCNTWQAAVGFDGSDVVMGQPVTSISLVGESGRAGVYGYNKTRTSVGLYLLDSYYDSQTNFASSGQSIILEYNDNFDDLSIGEPTTLTVVGKVEGSSSFAIEENQMVLTRRDDCTATWVDFAIGEEVTLTFHTQDDRWTTVDWGLGGKTLVSNGVVTTDNIDRATASAARTAIGLKADGTVVMAEFDGASTTSVGLTAQQLGDQMVALGCTTVICLDGGGSSTMAMQSPDTAQADTINNPSDGSEREVSNYIILVSNANGDGDVDSLYIAPDYRYLLPNATTDFAITLLDDGFDNLGTAAPDSATASSGTVQGTTYYADGSTGQVTINVSAEGVSGQAQVFIVNDPTAVSIERDGQPITSLAAATGDVIDLSAAAARAGVEVACTDEQMTWAVSGDVGTIDGQGVFTATQRGDGKITLSYNGVAHTIPVTVGLSVAQNGVLVADFESTLPFSSPDATLLRTTSTEAVASGAYAMGGVYSGTSATLSYNSIDDIDVTAYDAISMWAKGDGTLEALFMDADGDLLTAKLGNLTTSAQQYLSVDIPSNAISFVGLRLSSGSSFAIDQIFISEFAPDASDYPTISLTSAPTTANTDSYTLTATVTMENGSYPVRAEQVSVAVDGTTIAASYNATTGALTVQLSAIPNGLHSVVITATNDAGNRSRICHQFTAGDTLPLTFEDTAGHWAQGNIEQLVSRGIMTGSVSNGKYYFYPDQNLTRAEFAAIIARALGMDTTTVTTSLTQYDDAAAIPTWAQGAVSAVTDAGLMSGASNGDQLLFNATASITRAEVMTVLSRATVRGFDTQDLTFTDNASIPSWATEHVAYTVSLGLIGGYPDGTLLPTGNITRAEIAAIFCRL